MSKKNKYWGRKIRGHKVHLNEKNPEAYIMVPCNAGVATIKLPRSEADVSHKGRGLTPSCMNATCANRNKALFPHPAHMIVFEESRTIVIDKLNKGLQPSHGIVYRHDNIKDIKIHDKLGPKEIVKLGLAEKVITLSPLQKATKSRVSKNRPPPLNPTGPQGPQAKSRQKVVRYGALRRAVAAGINISQSQLVSKKKNAA